PRARTSCCCRAAPRRCGPTGSGSRTRTRRGSTRSSRRSCRRWRRSRADPAPPRRSERRSTRENREHHMATDRFPSPFELDPPPGGEDWRELYSYADVFSEDRREYEDNTFWFQDSIHWGWALTPFDASLMTLCMASLSQYNSRIFKVPPSQGVDARIL